jgi:hypothetical protein
MIEHPESYAIPSLKFLSKKLAAEPPGADEIVLPQSTINLFTMSTVSVPQVIPVASKTPNPFQPTTQMEASLNTLVQYSIQGQYIMWVCLDAGFPTIPLHLSEVCRDFSFDITAVTPIAQEK